MADGRSEADADAASDTESVNALLSPSDGYFSETTVPNTVLLPDPRQRNTQADKEREAREEQEQQQAESSRLHRAATQAPAPASASPPARRPISASSWRSSIVDTEASEREPLIPAAPPAYADITRDTNIGHGAPPLSYNTMGRESSFFPTRSPQDLGGAEQQPLLGNHNTDPSENSWRDDLRKSRRLLKLLVLLCLVVGGLALLITMLKYGLSPEKHNRNMPENHAGARPLPASCRSATFRANDSFTLVKPKSFNFLEQHRESNGYDRHPIRISGDVRLQSVSGQWDAVKVDVDYRTNRESVLEEVGLKSVNYGWPGEDTIELWVPGYVKGATHDADPTCLDLDITISIAPGTSFEEFFLSLQQLNIGIEHVDYSAGLTVLNTITGNVRCPTSSSVNSREIKIHSGTGTVTGTYPLYDLLSIDCGTGTVDVHVEPKKADKHDLPAKFDVKSETGSVTAVASLRELPERDYQTTIITGTGSISVRDLMHGSRTELRARTSSIDAKLHPVGPLKEQSRIDASTLTGTITVGVSPHLWKPDRHMRHLSGHYSSNTATIKVTHPLQWEGTVRAHTGTGSLDVDWAGLTRGSGNDGSLFPPWVKFPGADFEGSKGKGDALVEVKSGTGSVHLYGRDEE